MDHARQVSQSVRVQQLVVVLDDRSDIIRQQPVKATRRALFCSTPPGGFATSHRGGTHRGGSLAGGVMMCGTVQCLWHGSQFDVSTGKVKAGPAKKEIAVYRVKEEEGEVRLVL